MSEKAQELNDKGADIAETGDIAGALKYFEMAIEPILKTLAAESIGLRPWLISAGVMKLLKNFNESPKLPPIITIYGTISGLCSFI